MLYTSNYYGAQIALGIAGDELIAKPLMEGFTSAVSELFTATKVTTLTDDAIRAASTLDDAVPTSSVADLDNTEAFYDDIFEAQREGNPLYEEYLDDLTVTNEPGLDELDQLYDNVYEPQTNSLDDLPTETGVKPITEGGVGEGGSSALPQGISQEQFSSASKLLRDKVGNISDDIVVQGSRASGTAKAPSDIDIALRVSPGKFDELINQYFKTPNPGSAKERTMLHAIKTGKIQCGEAKLKGLRLQLQDIFEMDVDISIIKIGGSFDNPPFIPFE